MVIIGVKRMYVTGVLGTGIVSIVYGFLCFLSNTFSLRFSFFLLSLTVFLFILLALLNGCHKDLSLFLRVLYYGPLRLFSLPQPWLVL